MTTGWRGGEEQMDKELYEWGKHTIDLVKIKETNMKKITLITLILFGIGFIAGIANVS